MSKHTAGPWRYWSCKVDSRMTPPMYDYAQFAGPSGHAFRAPLRFLSEGDARLIAAAPDLLEALQGLVAWADDLQRQDPVEDLRKARAAIAKATGNAA